MNRFRHFAAAFAAAALAPFVFADEAAPVPVAAPAESVPAEAAPAAGVPAEAPKKELSETQKKQLEIRLVNARKAKIDAEMALAKARLAEELAPRNAARARLEAETALRNARTAAKLADTDAAKRKLDSEAARDKARDDLAALERESRLRAQELDLKISRLEQELELARYARDIARVKATETLRGLVPAAASECVYRKDPVEDGKLFISDRRIAFNGVVTPELAEYVCSRIYFYNNRSTEYPIFIVIDSSPGGSVAAGYQILKAMESSKAPVYVVVKSYAASMAAMITTLAERSFCYPGTVVLQHQPSSGMKGNLTQMRESLEQTTRWTRNINDVLAKKIGMTYEEYVAEMYRHNSRGDWSEFGEGAKKWKWVTDVVDTMEEAGVVRKSDDKAGAPSAFGEYRFDERGKPYVELPTLPAGDAWMIYDPENRYRVGA